MKNIYLISTNKPSKLQLQKVTKELLLYNDSLKEDAYTKPVNMYITSDEEIKEGDYITDGVQIGKYSSDLFENAGLLDISDWKKIILTNNEDLIKDGVQDIPDEFLKWFIKNPTCEKIEVRKIEDELISPKNPKIRFNALQDPPSFISAESLNNMILTYKYKIINPKEPKPIHEQIIDAVGGADRFREIVGIKHQQKHSYTEEDVKNAFLDGWQLRDEDLPFPKAKKKWFNEIKKK